MMPRVLPEILLPRDLPARAALAVLSPPDDDHRPLGLDGAKALPGCSEK
jgi:hypothetical protein